MATAKSSGREGGVQAAKPQGPQELGSTLCIPGAGVASPLLLLSLSFGLEALYLPAQIRDDVRVLRDTGGRVQQVTLHLVGGGGGTHSRGQHLRKLPCHVTCS